MAFRQLPHAPIIALFLLGWQPKRETFGTSLEFGIIHDNYLLRRYIITLGIVSLGHVALCEPCNVITRRLPPVVNNSKTDTRRE